MVVKNVSQSILNPRSKMSTRLLGNQQVSLSFVGTVIHTSQGGQLGLFLPCLLAHLYPAEHGSLTKVSSRARSAPKQADCPHTWLTSRLGPLAIVYTIIPSCLSHARFNFLFILILICSTSEISLYCSWSKCLISTFLICLYLKTIWKGGWGT